MKVEFNTKVISCSHEDIVRVLSLMSLCPWFSVEYDKEFYGELQVKDTHGTAFEDKVADTLLNGGNVYFFDEYARGKQYSPNSEVVDGDRNGVVMYKINIFIFKQGLEAAFNGCIVDDTDDDSDTRIARVCAEKLLDHDPDFLTFDASVLVQIICFSRIIYA